jgi:hypothetical protein
VAVIRDRVKPDAATDPATPPAADLLELDDAFCRLAGTNPG